VKGGGGDQKFKTPPKMKVKSGAKEAEKETSSAIVNTGRVRRRPGDHHYRKRGGGGEREGPIGINVRVN